ncbi:MAG: discoidin domain-containing protein [Planctomycetes bacterium]|nr:discoidin domain-containing protein [Planctomycetota bacterium]
MEEVKEAVTAGAEMAPLDIKLPKPMFVGTPQDTRVANLRKPTGKARPPFLAPVGAQLLSLNKPVSASDEEPIIGDIEMITDGDKEAADGSYVELGPFLQWVQVDLEQEAEIAAIVVWHYHKQPRVYFDVVVQISNDKDFITDVKTVFNNDIDNSSGLGIGTDMHYTETSEGELIDCVSQGTPKGRYVRLYSNGNTSNDLNHYIEVDVYGKPVQ